MAKFDFDLTAISSGSLLFASFKASLGLNQELIFSQEEAVQQGNVQNGKVLVKAIWLRDASQKCRASPERKIAGANVRPGLNVQSTSVFQKRSVIDHNESLMIEVSYDTVKFSM